MAYYIISTVTCSTCNNRQKVKFESTEEKLENLKYTKCDSCGNTTLYSEKNLTIRNLICNTCQHTEEKSFDNYDDYVAKRKTLKCSKCNSETMETYLSQVPVVQYLGTGWTNAWTQSNFSRKSPESQRRLDAALRENDALEHAADHDPKFIKARDTIKKFEESNS